MNRKNVYSLFRARNRHSSYATQLIARSREIGSEAAILEFVQTLRHEASEHRSAPTDRHINRRFLDRMSWECDGLADDLEELVLNRVA